MAEADGATGGVGISAGGMAGGFAPLARVDLLGLGRLVAFAMAFSFARSFALALAFATTVT
jgi:hypothetical protein